MTEVPESSNKKRNIVPLIIGAVAVLTVIAAGGFFALNRFSQASQASAEAMPPQTLAYASFDAINLLDPRNWDTLQAAFGDFAPDEAEIESQEDATEQLNSELSNYGISFDEDIQSWLGRSVGAGILSVTVEDGEPDDAEFVMAAEIRDRGAADDFLDKFDGANTVTAGEYEGIEYRTENTVTEGYMLVLGRSDSIMLIASSEAAFEQAVDAQNGESLATQQYYIDSIDRLPEQRALTFMLLRSGVERMLAEVPEQSEGLAVPTALDPDILTEQLFLDSLQTLFGSLSVSDNGIELDLASLHDSEMVSEETRDLFTLVNSASGELPSVLPIDTVLYLGGLGLGNNWERIKESVGTTLGSTEDFEDSLLLAEQTLGFSVENDLMPQLVGDFGLAVYPTTDSSIAEFAQVDVGLTMVQAVSDSAEMSRIADQLGASLNEQGLLVTSTDGVSTIDFLGSNVASFGVNSNYFAISTGASDISGLTNGDKLADSPLFEQAQGGLPDGMMPLMYLDTQAAFAILDSLETAAPDELADLQAFSQRIPLITMGQRGSEDGGAIKFILFVDEEN